MKSLFTFLSSAFILFLIPPNLLNPTKPKYLILISVKTRQRMAGLIGGPASGQATALLLLLMLTSATQFAGSEPAATSATSGMAWQFCSVCCFYKTFNALKNSNGPLLEETQTGDAVKELEENYVTNQLHIFSTMKKQAEVIVIVTIPGNLQTANVLVFPTASTFPVGP